MSQVRLVGTQLGDKKNRHEKKLPCTVLCTLAKNVESYISCFMVLFSLSLMTELEKQCLESIVLKLIYHTLSIILSSFG